MVISFIVEGFVWRGLNGMAQYYVVMWSLVKEIMVLLVIHSMLEDSQVHLQT